MTVNEIKGYFSKFNIKTKTNISGEKELTQKDIEDGKIFQKFILKSNLQQIVEGLDISPDDGEIYYYYPVLEKIEIEADDNFPACGGELKLTVNAFYTINRCNINGKVSVFINECKNPINALIKIDNAEFSYSKPFIVNKVPNYGDEEKIVNVTSTYYFGGKKYTANKTIIQGVNKVSSWLIESEPTISIKISLDANEISNKGGFAVAKVERQFTRIYYKQDSCGNKVGGKSEPGLTEDITSKSLITCSNKKFFTANKNIISVSKQEIGALKRESKITARYLDFSDTCVLTQKEGGKVEYTYTLSFENGSLNKFLDLETSVQTEKLVKLISKKNVYVDGEYVNTSLCNEIKIKSNDDWLTSSIKEINGDVYALINVIEVNKDRENDREALLTIENANDTSLKINLIASQPALDIKEEEYHCPFIGNGSYTSEELSKRAFYFKPYKALVYENGEKDIVKLENDFIIKPFFKSENETLLNVREIVKTDENYFLTLNNFSSHSMKDINLTGKLVFYNNNNEKIFESEKANITVKGNQIIGYNYELCFDGHNKFCQLTWDNETSSKHININSLKYKLVNGKNDSLERIPFKIKCLDINGKEIQDNVFSVKETKNGLSIFPIKFDNNYERIYTIEQKESNIKIFLKLLSIKPKEKQLLKLPLKVIICSETVGKDLWTGEHGYLLIDGKETIKLNPCWLSPNATDNKDIAYNGEIELEEGTHTFETFNIICIEYNNKKHVPCNIAKKIGITDKTESIILEVKI